MKLNVGIELGDAICKHLIVNLPGMFFRAEAGEARKAVLVSEGGRELTRYNNLYGMELANLVHRADRDWVAREVTQQLEANGTVKLDFRIVTADGEIRWVREISKAVIDVVTGDRFVEGLWQDCTAEKDKETLDNAVVSYRNALNNGSIVSVSDKHGNIIYANDLFCRYSKYSRKELIGRSHNIVNSGYHPKSFFQGMWQTISSGKIWRGEIRNRAKDGSYYWVDTVISPVFNSLGEIEQYISIRNLISDKKELELRLKDLTSTMPLVVFQFRRNANGAYSFPFVSGNVDHLIGLEAEIINQSAERAFSVIHPHDLKFTLEAIEQSAASLQPLNHTLRIVKHDNIHWVSATMVPRMAEDGAVVWNGTATDITGIKSMEHDFSNLNSQLTYMYEVLKDCFWGADVVHNRMTYVSPGCEDVYGHSREEFLENPDLWYDVIVEEDKPAFVEIWQQLREGKVINHEFRIRHKADSIRWLEVRMRGTLDNKGTLVRLDGFTTNIDSRKKEELRLQRITAILEEAQRIAKIGSWDLDLTKNQLNWSEELYQIFERNPSESIASYENFLALVHPDDRNMVDEAYTYSLIHKTPYEVEHRLLFPDGRIKYVREKCETQYHENGEAIMSVGTTQDITEQWKHSRKLEKLVTEQTQKNLELEKRNIELDRFVYSTSHDLRAPLLSILGLINTIDDNMDDEKLVKTTLQYMKQSVARCDGTIKSIIEYARNNKQDVTISQVPVKQIISDIIDNYSYISDTSNIEFVSRIQNQNEFYSDATRLQSLVSNLISNSVKYQRKNEPEKRIEVEFFVKDNYGVLKVFDNGEGIEAHKINQVFEMFVRNSSQSSGSGLGLYICKEIVEKLGGYIDIHSIHGKHTEITILLPNQPQST